MNLRPDNLAILDVPQFVEEKAASPVPQFLVGDITPDDLNVDVPLFGAHALVETLSRRIIMMHKIVDPTPNCQAAAFRAAQMCLTYGLFPGDQVHIYDLGDDEWVADAGIRAWIQAANAYHLKHGGKWMFSTKQLDIAQVRKLNPGRKITNEDLGYMTAIIRSDDIAMAKAAGMPYEPQWSTGFWFAFAREEKGRDGRPTGKWLPDPIWNGRTADEVARQRSQKAALMALYTLEISPAASSMQRRGEDLLLTLDRQLAPSPNSRAMFAERKEKREADGDVLFAA